MKVAPFEFNPFGERTYIVWDETSCEAAIIDPGMWKRHDFEAIEQYISSHNLKLKYMLFTHMHVDHTFGADFISRNYKLGVSAHRAESHFGWACLFSGADTSFKNDQ